MTMLHQFTFKNFKSFKEETTLDLLASSIKEHPHDVVTDVMEEKVLKVAAIYGANASGKSNVIEAFEAMRNLVLYSFRQNVFSTKNDVVPHWFEDKNVPTEFTVIFSTANDIYQYGFSILKGVILEEYLYQRDPKIKKEAYVELFSRNGDGLSGALLHNPGTQNILELIEEDTLLISVISKLKIPVAQTVFDWFKEVRIIDYGNPRKELRLSHFNQGYVIGNPLLSLLEDESEKKKLERFIKAIDVGIDKLGIVQDALTEDSLNERSINELKRIVTYHKNPKTGELLLTPLESESSGTLKMLTLYVDLKSILDSGGTIFVDELDAKLHPLLIRYIIIMFHDEKMNPNHAQLIFSTQEIFTLDKDNFRRDEIWFTDKNDDGVSDLYSLSDYVDDEEKKVRNDASYGKDYILGRYKSIPTLRRIEDIDG
jgi:AAA15 family ATPase/GTPase